MMFKYLTMVSESEVDAPKRSTDRGYDWMFPSEVPLVYPLGRRVSGDGVLLGIKVVWATFVPHRLEWDDYCGT